MSVGAAWKREVRVALSRKAQPIWFRVVKWACIAAVVVFLWGSSSFWFWILGATGLALTLHLFWRWRTKGWTRPWGEWDDVETANNDPGAPR